MKKINNIVKLTKDYEKDWGIVYADKNSLSYKVFRTVFTVAAFFAVIMGIFAEIGQKIALDNAGDIIDKNFTFDFYLTLLSCLILVLAVISIFFKKTYIAFILSFIAGIYQLFFFKNIMTGANMTAGINIDYWWRHFIPLIVALFCILADFIIDISAALKFNRSYGEVMRKIFLRFEEKHRTLSDEDWAKFLESYQPDNFFNKKEKTGFD